MLYSSFFFDLGNRIVWWNVRVQQKISQVNHLSEIVRLSHDDDYRYDGIIMMDTHGHRKKQEQKNTYYRPMNFSLWILEIGGGTLQEYNRNYLKKNQPPKCKMVE